jgi:hypothetical protein
MFFEHAQFGFLGGLPRTNSRAYNVHAAGKMRGIPPIQLPFSKIHRENICEFSNLRANSLRRPAGNFFADARK